MRRLFIMRKDLHMSPGKLAAQVSHCAEAYWTNKMKNSKRLVYDGEVLCQVWVNEQEYNEYLCGIFTKTVCEARNKNHLMKAVEMAEEMGLVDGEDYGIIADACLTELEPEEEDGRTITGIWFKPLPDEMTHKISRKYQLYR